MLYRKIKGIRSDLGLTQQEMANYLGISIRAYRNKEKGEACLLYTSPSPRDCS